MKDRKIARAMTVGITPSMNESINLQINNQQPKREQEENESKVDGEKGPIFPKSKKTEPLQDYIIGQLRRDNPNPDNESDSKRVRVDSNESNQIDVLSQHKETVTINVIPENRKVPKLSKKSKKDTQTSVVEDEIDRIPVELNYQH